MDILIQSLMKEYRRKQVLNISSLRIKKGTINGIVGPNGAGKSTLIHILGGVEKPTKGSILYDGVEKFPADYKEITVVFQKPYLLKTTVYHNIAYPLKLRGFSGKEIKNKVNQVLEDMGIESLKEQKAGTLSGGEMQKVALARSLVFEPSLLLLDEPTANIDPSSMAVMERMITRVNESYGTTVMMITHNIEQAKRICDEIIVMNDGKVVESGAIDEVIIQSKNATILDFSKEELAV